VGEPHACGQSGPEGSWPCDGLGQGGGPTLALTMAARKAFWSLPESYLRDLSRLLGLTTFGGSLLDKLTKLVQHILGEQSADDLLAILSQRAFNQDDCWDTDWMSSQPLLAELGAEELEAAKDSLDLTWVAKHKVELLCNSMCYLWVLGLLPMGAVLVCLSTYVFITYIV